jgi:hypothetical protein
VQYGQIFSKIWPHFGHSDIFSLHLVKVFNNKEQAAGVEGILLRFHKNKNLIKIHKS